MKPAKKITVLGSGSWGTALAIAMTRAHHAVVLWGRDATQIEAINQTRCNGQYLAGIRLPDNLHATSNLDGAVDNADIILLVTPAQTIGDIANQLRGKLPEQVELILCAKGIDKTTAQTPVEMVEDLLPIENISVLSGPSFASDVAQGLPTAVTLANTAMTRASLLAAEISSPNFRVYAGDDVVGVELGGALKNVLALAVGVARGLDLGASCEAALIARGFAELQRIGHAFGAKPQTLMGLSGLGDLVLTASTPQSRNFSYGMALGRSENTDELPLAEGVHTAQIAAQLAGEKKVEAPILEMVAKVLKHEVTADQAVRQLLDRPLRAEH